MDVGRINVRANFDGDDDRNPDKAIRDGKRLTDEAKKNIEELEGLEEHAFQQSREHNAETVKSNERVKRSNEDLAQQRKQEIAAKTRLSQLEKEYERIQEERGRKSAIRTKKDRDAVIEEIELLKEIRELQESLGVIDARKERRLKTLEDSFQKFTAKVKDSTRAEEDLASASERAGDAIEKKGRKARKAAEDSQPLIETSEQLALNLDAEADATDRLNESRERLSRGDQDRDARRRTSSGRGRGGGGVVPPGGGGGRGGDDDLPPGGLPDPEDYDFDFDKYIQKIQERIRQTIVETETSRGRALRYYQDELKLLSDREKFARRAVDLEGARALAVVQVEELRGRIEDESDQSAIRRLRNEIESLTRKINEADEALKNQRGNADGLRDSLRRSVFQAQQLVDRTREDGFLREESIQKQRELINGEIELADEKTRSLTTTRDELSSATARAVIEKEISRIAADRRALSLQLQRDSVLTDRELERIAIKSEDINQRSEAARRSAIEVEDRYYAVISQSQEALRNRLDNLRVQIEGVSDPSSQRRLQAEIDRTRDLLDDINLKYKEGRGNVDQISEAVDRQLQRASRVVVETRDQNAEYEKQRELAEINTRGLRDDIRTQRLILDNLLAQTKSLEVQRQLKKSIADLDALEERRQRAILSDDFSPEQFDRLALETQVIFRRNLRAREEALRVEREYNAEIRNQSALVKEIKELLGDRDPLFKAGFTTSEINKFEDALEKLRRELEDTSRAGRSLDGLGVRLRRFRDDLNNSRVPLNRFELAIARLRDRLGFLGRAFSSLDSQSRGFSLFTTLATTIVEPLAAVIVQLAGGLLAVASSALAAGTALGGALVAGAAQALPVIGLLAAGFKSLIDVVQISNRQRQDEASNSAREARGVGGAAQNVNRLADANENLVEAQRRLSDARRQAIRDLEDLADKERQAELAARSATLSVADALIALDAARASGSALDIRRAQIELAGARISERQAERDLGRTRFDTATQRAEGVEGSDQVVSAKRALTQAERALAEARTAGAGAASALSQATARLNEQIEDLSPGQRELLDGINRLREVFRSGPFVEIRDIILQPFVAATEALADLGSDSGLVGSFIALANAISRTLRRSIESLFGERTRDFIKFINGEAVTNVDLLFRGFEALGSILADISQGAAGTFRDILLGLVETLERIDRALSGEGLTEFFSGLGESVSAFGQLTEETFLLLKNLFELSAPAGNTLVSTFATFLRSINQQLADPVRRREIRQWFEDVAVGTAAFGTALKDLTVAIFGGLNPDRLRQFSVVISDVLAPAIRTLIVFSARLFDVLSQLERLPLAKELTAFTIATIVLGRTFTTILGITGLFLGSLRNLIGAFGAVRAAASAATGASALAGFSQGLIIAGGSARDADRNVGRFSRTLRGLAGARGVVAGLGLAIQRLGPYGLAAGTALLLFGDQILDLVRSTNDLEESARNAGTALAALEGVGSEESNARLRLRQSRIDVRTANLRLKEAIATREAAKKQLEEAETDEARAAARRFLEAAEIEIQNATLGIDIADQALKDSEKRVREASAATTEQAERTAAAVRKSFDSVRKTVESTQKQIDATGDTVFIPQSGRAPAPAGATATSGLAQRIRTPEERFEDLKEVLYDDATFKEMEDYVRGKVLGVLQTIIETKGELPQKDLEIVFEAIADGKSIRKVLEEIDIKIPKEVKINAFLNEQEISAAATRTGRQIEDVFISRLRLINDIAGGTLPEFKTRPSPLSAREERQSSGNFADGGIVKATPGGVVIRAAEDGYDEFVITSDPTKRGKSRDVLRRAARAILSEDPTQRNDQYGISEGDPPSLRGRGRGSAATPPASPLAGFFTMFRTAQGLDERDIPYSWGGGHITPASPTTGIRSDGNDGTDIVGLDCSSSVSAVLQSAYPGFPTITSGEFPNQGIMNPGQGLVTVWSNNKHVFMTFGTEDWGTNSGEPGGGPGFHSHTRSGFTPSYPDGLGLESSEGGLFGSVYNYLTNQASSQINKIEDQFYALGRSADDIPGVVSRSLGDRDNNPLALFYDGAAAAISQGLSLFQQFQDGGEIQGRTGEAQIVVAHAGETVLDIPTSRSLKEGKVSREIVDAFIKEIKTALRQAGPELAKSLGNFFSTYIGIGDTNLNKAGVQAGFVNNVTVDNRPGRPGGASRFNILEGALQFLEGGFDPQKDPDARAIINTTSKRIREALNKTVDKFAGFLGRLSGQIQNIIEAGTQRLTGIQNELAEDQLNLAGSFNPATNLFSFFGGTGFGFSQTGGLSGFSAQQYTSVSAIREERDALQQTRESLVADKEAVDAIIGRAESDLNALRGKKTALESALSALQAKRARFVSKRNDAVAKAKTRQGKNKARNYWNPKIAQVDELIRAVKAEISATQQEIDLAEKTIADAQVQSESIGAQITSTTAQIAASQGQEIDALISQATSGRYSTQQAERFLGEAEALAQSTNDQVRLEAIRRARFQLGQTQAGALIGEQQAALRLADLTGDEAGRRTALENIGTILAQQRIDTQAEIDRLLAEGLDPNSTEMANLRTALLSLDIAIRENTDALNGTTTQNFSSTAWQLFRRAIFGGESQLLPGFSDAMNLAVQPVTNPAVTQPDMVYTLPYGPESDRSQLPDKGDTTTNITVNVNESEQTVDPTYLASRLAFALDGKA